MSELAERLIEQALDLPPDERARVAERLLSRMEPELIAIDQLWAVEAEDRLDGYETGEITAIPAEEVFKSIKNRKRYAGSSHHCGARILLRTRYHTKTQEK